MILTGGSSGIGKSFIELGAKLNPALQFCNLSRSAPAINLPKLNLRHFPCDLGNSTQLEQAVSEVKAHLMVVAPQGRVLLINNSGFGKYGVFSSIDVATQAEIVDVNIRAVVHLTGRLLPLLRTRGGAILNVASTAAFQPTPYLSVYGASKAFVLHWSLALNEELRGSTVRALAVCPGPTATDFSRRAGLDKPPRQAGMTSEEVVLASYRALAAGHSQVITGWRNRVTATVASMLPPAWVAPLARKVINRYRMRRLAK